MVTKRKQVKVKIIDRMHEDGTVVEVYRMMEELVAKFHRELAEAKIVLMWKEGWAEDIDGIRTLARIKKATDVDKALARDGIDFVIQLNHEVWPGLATVKQAQIIDHELCHAAPDMDEDGEQKMDEMDRLCWRLRKHPIQEFPEIIRRYGLEAVLQLGEDARDAVEQTDRPLLREENCRPADDKWREHSLAAAAFSDKEEELLEAAEITTLGQLQDLIDQNGEDWGKGRGIHGNARKRIEGKMRDYLADMSYAAP